MTSSVTERILGTNRIYTDRYLKNTILLTKSVVVKCEKEADLYNSFVIEMLKQPVDKTNKLTWRYYHHLTAKYHPVDKPITVISLDNGQEITLDRTTIEIHKYTREELLKFDYYYKELVDRYPDQELFIKSLIATSPRLGIEEVISLEDFSIISYNSILVEEQETNLIPLLQVRIHNYKITRLLTTYALMDSYYLASLYHVFYNFIVTNLIGLRLDNAKTPLAHSYHILNYLASHHGLDKHYNYLTKNQILFLYRNLLYLNNHSGRNHVFKTLIQKLFTDNKVSVVNYRLKQQNSTTLEGNTEYRFNQVLLNDANLVYNPNDFSLDELKERELTILPNNEKEYEFHQSEIDHKLKNTLFSTLVTKDLEITLTDNSNDVKHKLIPTIMDYWAYMLKTKQLNYVATVVDPITNVSYSLRVEDLFKLFSVVIHKYNAVEIEEFPSYFCPRVYKQSLPSLSSLYTKFYKKEYSLTKTCEYVHFSVPSYRYCNTSYAFNQMVTQVYKFNLGLWLLAANVGDKDNNAQLDLFIENLHTKDTYRFNNETVTDFLKRIAFENLKSYNTETLFELLTNILNAATYNKLGDLGRNKYTQEALVSIFRQFTSYTTQVIDKYLSSESTLLGLRSPSYGIDNERSTRHYYIHNSEYVDIYNRKKEQVEVSVTDKAAATNRYLTTIPYNPSETLVQQAQLIFYSSINLPASYPIDIEDTQTEPDQDLLLFLSLNS